jgi:hypothetical protein
MPGLKVFNRIFRSVLFSSKRPAYGSRSIMVLTFTDEILLRGNEHMTMFLMNLKDAWRKGELSKFKNLQ